ncbi:MAG: hypothetical protein ACKO3T_25300 [Planctomycetaceae bacterium]
MPIRNLCRLAAVVCVLAGELASAQQSGLSERMRQQAVRPPQRHSSSSRVTTFSGVQPAAADPVIRQVPMREKIRPAVLTRELPADAGVAAAGGRPIELMGFSGEEADASEFLETLETPPPQARVTKRTAPAVAESGAGAGGKVRKPVSRPAAAKAPAAARAPAVAERSVAVEGSAVAAAGPQQPMASMEWVYPTEMTPGVECTVRLVVRNSGSATLFGAVADVLCPTDVELLETNPAAEPSAEGELSWPLGSLRSGETREISLRIRPQSAGEQHLEASLSLRAAAVCRLNITEPGLELSVVAAGDSELGQQTSVMVEVSNPGSGRAEDVVLVASLPEGLEHKSGAVVTVDIGSLSPGESRKVRLSMTATAGGLQRIELKAAGAGELLAEATANVNVAAPQLQLVLQTPDQEIAGQSGSYVLQLENTGVVATSNVRARYVLPAGFEFVSADRGGRYLAAERCVEWFVGTVNSGEMTEFTAVLQAGRSGRSVHHVTAQTDFGALAAAEEVTEVEGSADLELELATVSVGGAAGSVLKSGQQTTLRVLIRNTGSEPARSVGMSCELPAGMTLIDVEGPSDYIAENGVLVFRSLPEISAGKAAEFLLQVRCSRVGTHSSRIRVASASTAQPVIGELRAEVQP